MVVIHLQTMHYHLGLICSCCLNYITTSTDAMHCHNPLCKSTAAGGDDDDDDEEEEKESPQDYKEEDNGDVEYKFVFKED